jgi:iron complex outermembrane receptor protein
MTARDAVLIGAWMLAAATTAGAQTSAPTPPAATTADAHDLTTLSLDELMRMNVDVVSSASKFTQEVTNAPASITIVTGDEIRRLGERTLKDILEGVRGFYTLDDRNYSYVGVRGFARPGDYNTRVLLLVNGHRTNDPIYDQARIGNELLVDVDAIERVEVIRGPGSSLYGTEAFFAVVNVITRKAASADGLRVGIGGGSLGTSTGRATLGHLFGNGADLFVSGAAEDATGNRTLYFPEFDAPATGFGIARNADGERHQQLFASLSLGAFTIRGASMRRAKHVATGAYDTVFGDARFVTRDNQSMVEGVYEGAFGRGWTGVARAGFDHYDYSGDYPMDYGDEGVRIYADEAHVNWLTSELTLNRRMGTRHVVTTGVEWRQSLNERQFSAEYTGVAGDIRTHSGSWGAYVQDEFTILPRLVVNGGARIDHLARFGEEVAPRAALIYHPARTTTFKLLHGRAFRAPNAYELYYYAAQAAVPSLEPEQIATTEGIWEQYAGRHLRSSVSIFESRISKLISQQAVAGETGDDLFFANTGTARAHGVEGELEGRWGRILTTRLSHTMVTTEDVSTHARLSNSPQNVTKFALIVPLAGMFSSVAVEGERIGSRLTIERSTLPSAYLTNVTLLSARLPHRSEFSFTIHNAFDRRYLVPAAEEHPEQAIAQDGRTLHAQLAVGF